jgi:ferritin-like metal-binding protein YciE
VPKNKPDAVHALRGLFTDELREIYGAEKALLKALPKMIRNVTAPELLEAMEKHLGETEHQVSRLEKIFDTMGVNALARRCEAMTGLIREATSIMNDTEKGPVRDAAIILSVQKVEHYEIASYGTLLAFARILEENEAETWIQETLEEEKGANEKLSAVAELYINIDAAVEPI